MKNKVLLVGNDINNVIKEANWADLLDSIMAELNIANQIDKNNKPFPLVYEQIFLKALKDDRYQDEFKLKKSIADLMSEMVPNEIHLQIMKMNFEHILTTNYDHNLEKSVIGESHKKLKNQGVIKESHHSLFRFHETDRKKIWHIHGDINYPASINLGYEQYSGYLQQMRNYVKGYSSYSNDKKFDHLITRFNNKPFQIDSWTDLFFTKDIYIMGLKMDLEEMHLWWFLNFRQREILSGRIKITNKIYYFYPSDLDISDGTFRTKLELFESFGVIAKSFKNPTKTEYYQTILDSIKTNKY